MDWKRTYHDQDGGRGGHLVDLDHGEDLRHLSLAGAGVEESGERNGMGKVSNDVIRCKFAYTLRNFANSL